MKDNEYMPIDVIATFNAKGQIKPLYFGVTGMIPQTKIENVIEVSELECFGEKCLKYISLHKAHRSWGFKRINLIYIIDKHVWTFIE